MCMMHSHDHDDHSEHGSGGNQSWLFSRTGIVTICVLAILGFLIYEGHGAHLLGLAPYLLLLVCPLMHIFMHGGHHHHHHEEHNPAETDKQDTQHKGGCH